VEKKKKQKRRISWLFIVFWVAIISLSLTFVTGQARRYSQLSTELYQAQSNLARERATFNDLYLQLLFFDSDAYIERLARERLGMVRPNEIVFRNMAAE